MDEPDTPSGGRRRAAPLSPEAEAARARAREQAPRSGRRRAVPGRRRASAADGDDPWTADTEPAPAPAPDAPDRRRHGAPDPTASPSSDPWLQDPLSLRGELTSATWDPQDPWASDRDATASGSEVAGALEVARTTTPDPSHGPGTEPGAGSTAAPGQRAVRTHPSHRRDLPPTDGPDDSTPPAEITSEFEPWSPVPPAPSEHADAASGPRTETSIASEVSDWTEDPAGETPPSAASTASRAVDPPSLPQTAPSAGSAPDAPGAPGAPDGERPPDPAAPRTSFRTEIHGLRGIAVLLVVVYHLWLGRVSGGVDVFLFLSAFFLTGAFARRLEQGRPLALRAYWARTFQRLYPPVTIVILGALALAVTVLPVTSWPMIQRHAVASSLYVQNVALALDSVDYYQHDASSASPLQHMWSLSIQGQVFLLWPLLIGLLALLGLRRRPRAVRPVLGIVFGLVGAASLTWSVLETSRDQTVAYFDTGARLWEFAAGSLLALALPAIDRALRARRPDAEERPGLRPLRALLGWAGVGALIACGLVLDVSTAFPGWIALWPLAAAALVIVAGHSGTRWGVDRLLGLRPVQGLGSISYALYLVHWPLLVGWLAWHGAGRAGLVDGFVLLAVSLVVAWGLTVLVDRPLHRSAWFAARRLRSLAAVAVCLVVLAAGSTVGFSAVTTQVIEGTGSGSPTARTPTPGATGSSTVSQSADAEHPGAAWTGSPLTAGGVAPVPRADQSYAPEDLLPEDCGGRYGPAEAVTCRSAPAVGTATATILIAGDSHSAQYSSAVSEAARSRGWTVYYVGKPGCSFSTGSGKPECATVDTIWPAVLDTLKPDVVVTLGSHSASDGTPEVARADLPAALALVQDRGIPALVLRDNPRWPVDEYACAFDALRAGGDPEAADAACGAPLTEKLAAQDPTLAFANTDPARRVAVADPSTAVLCPRGRCSPIIGNVYVYRDDDHLTADFSATMAPWLGARIDEVLGAGAPSDG